LDANTPIIKFEVAMAMFGIKLDAELEARLDRLAKETGRSKSYYAKLAIKQFLEDREDYLRGIAALERNEPRISLEQLERELGLDH
jgi:RHH-type transcriptional regulator, rel operon repressor / antitoxin RelB